MAKVALRELQGPGAVVDRSLCRLGNARLSACLIVVA